MTDIIMDHGTIMQSKYTSRAVKSDGLVTIFVRNYSKKAIKLKMKKNADLKQFREQIAQRMRVNIEDQVLFLHGQEIDTTKQQIELFDGLIFHMINKKRVNVPQLSVILHRIEPNAPAHRVTVSPDIQISYFMQNIFSKKYENYRNYFLVYAGRELQGSRTFGEEFVEDGCEILVVHRVENLKSQSMVVKKEGKAKEERTQRISIGEQRNKNTNEPIRQSTIAENIHSVPQNSVQQYPKETPSKPPSKQKINNSLTHNDQSFQSDPNIPNQLYQTAKFNVLEDSNGKAKVEIQVNGYERAGQRQGQGEGEEAEEDHRYSGDLIQSREGMDRVNNSSADMEETQEIVIGNNNAFLYVTEKPAYSQLNFETKNQESSQAVNNEIQTRYGLVPKKQNTEFHRENSERTPMAETDPTEILPIHDSPIKDDNQPQANNQILDNNEPSENEQPALESDPLSIVYKITLQPPSPTSIPLSHTLLPNPTPSPSPYPHPHPSPSPNQLLPQPNSPMKSSNTHSFSNIHMTIKTISSRYGDEMNASVKQRVEEEGYLDDYDQSGYSESVIYVDRKESTIRYRSKGDKDSRNSSMEVEKDQGGEMGKGKGKGIGKREEDIEDYDKCEINQGMSASKIVIPFDRKKKPDQLSRITEESYQNQSKELFQRPKQSGGFKKQTYHAGGSSPKQKDMAQTVDPQFFLFRNSNPQPTIETPESLSLRRSEKKSIQHHKAANVKIQNATRQKSNTMPNLNALSPTPSEINTNSNQSLSGGNDSNNSGQISSSKSSRFRMKRTMSFQYDENQENQFPGDGEASKGSKGSGEMKMVKMEKKERKIDGVVSKEEEKGEQERLMPNIALCSSEVQPFNHLKISSDYKPLQQPQPLPQLQLQLQISQAQPQPEPQPPSEDPLLQTSKSPRYPNISNISEATSVYQASQSDHKDSGQLLISKFGWTQRFPLRTSFTSNVEENSSNQRNQISLGTVESHTIMSKESRESRDFLLSKESRESRESKEQKEEENNVDSSDNTGKIQRNDSAGDGAEGKLLRSAMSKKNRVEEIQNISEILENQPMGSIKESMEVEMEAEEGEKVVRENGGLDSLLYSEKNPSSQPNDIGMTDTKVMETEIVEQPQLVTSSFNFVQPTIQQTSEPNLLESETQIQIQPLPLPKPQPQAALETQTQSLPQPQSPLHTSITKAYNPNPNQKDDSLLLQASGTSNRIQSSENLLDDLDGSLRGDGSKKEVREAGPWMGEEKLEERKEEKEREREEDNLLDYVVDSGEKPSIKKNGQAYLGLRGFQDHYQNQLLFNNHPNPTQAHPNFQFLLSPSAPLQAPSFKIGDLILLASTTALNLNPNPNPNPQGKNISENKNRNRENQQDQDPVLSSINFESYGRDEIGEQQAVDLVEDIRSDILRQFYELGNRGFNGGLDEKVERGHIRESRKQEQQNLLIDYL